LFCGRESTLSFFFPPLGVLGPVYQEGTKQEKQTNLGETDFVGVVVVSGFFREGFSNGTRLVGCCREPSRRRRR
jgi:hypothetical protein